MIWILLYRWVQRKGLWSTTGENPTWWETNHLCPRDRVWTILVHRKMKNTSTNSKNKPPIIDRKMIKVWLRLDFSSISYPLMGALTLSLPTLETRWVRPIRELKAWKRFFFLRGLSKCINLKSKSSNSSNFWIMRLMKRTSTKSRMRSNSSCFWWTFSNRSTNKWWRRENK